MYTIDCEGTCGGAATEGCIDPTACNYDATASCDDGSCTFAPCTPGCTDPCSSNYDPSADGDDGSCLPYDSTCNTDCTLGDITQWDATTCQCELVSTSVDGCVDMNACNYDPAANCDDGSCIYKPVCDADPCTNGGIYVWNTTTCQCELTNPTVNGCTDVNACNYDPTANCDDGSCILETTCDTDVCTNGGIYTWNMVSCQCELTTPTVNGCTNMTACNYDPVANCSDGSCIFETSCDGNPCTNGGIYTWNTSTCQCELATATVNGCTDPSACNYDDTANCDDGSCDFDCQVGAISSTIFVDENDNGVLDPGEVGVPGVIVNITGAGPDGVLGTSDDLYYQLVTGNNGVFAQGNLPAGDYQVTIDLPQGTIYTFNNGTTSEIFVTVVFDGSTTFLGIGGVVPVQGTIIAGCELVIPLSSGWDMISSYCIPQNDSMAVIFRDIEDDVIQVKNLTHFYIPSLNVNTFELGFHRGWDITQGYQVKTTNATNLVIDGIDQADPMVDVIPLNAGWNIIAYWLQGNAMPENVFNNISNDVIQVKDLVNFYLPSIGINNGLVMKLTRGYQVKMANANTLQYDPNHAFRPEPEEENPLVPTHYVWTGMPHPNNAILVVKDALLEDINYGDEIGVFSESGILVGSMVYQGEEHLAMMLYGDDETEEGLDGALQNELFVVKHWDKLSQSERLLDLTFVEGPSYYEKDALSIAEFKSDITGIGEIATETPVQAVPNPVKDEVVFNLQLVEPVKDLNIALYNLAGKLVMSLDKQDLATTQVHSLSYNLSELPNGVYMYQVVGDGKLLGIDRLTIAR